MSLLSRAMSSTLLKKAHLDVFLGLRSLHQLVIIVAFLMMLSSILLLIFIVMHLISVSLIIVPCLFLMGGFIYWVALFSVWGKNWVANDFFFSGRRIVKIIKISNKNLTDLKKNLLELKKKDSTSPERKNIISCMLSSIENNALNKDKNFSFCFVRDISSIQSLYNELDPNNFEIIFSNFIERYGADSVLKAATSALANNLPLFCSYWNPYNDGDYLWIHHFNPNIMIPLSFQILKPGIKSFSKAKAGIRAEFIWLAYSVSEHSWKLNHTNIADNTRHLKLFTPDMIYQFADDLCLKSEDLDKQAKRHLPECQEEWKNLKESVKKYQISKPTTRHQ